MTDETLPTDFKGPWHCFHCGEVCKTFQEGIDHFGYDETEMPACVTILKEGEKAIIEDRREWRERCHEEKHQHEHTSQKLSDLGWSVWEIIRNETKYQRLEGSIEQKVDDLRMIWDSMEGRALAAESTLSVLPRWLRESLSRVAERRANQHRRGGFHE